MEMERERERASEKKSEKKLARYVCIFAIDIFFSTLVNSK